MKNLFTTLVICVIFLYTSVVNGQEKKKERKRELYFSWGYNKEWYTRSSLHVKQFSNNDAYTFQHVRGHDHPGWNEGLFNKAISIPQYNYRLGYVFDRLHGWGFEINFDHTKYIISDQDVVITGTRNGKQADSSLAFTKNNGFYYFLNNGANFLLFNVVKRWRWLVNKKQSVVMDVYAKAGFGPVIPHVQNQLFGKDNNPGFQFGGLNTGVEGTVRTTFFSHVYLEYCNKLDYARYWNLQVYDGKAKQNFGTYEMILNLGLAFHIGKRIK